MKLIEKGTYHVKHTISGLLIATDDYSIQTSDDYYFVESKMHLFGSNGFSQIGHFIFDISWHPKKGELEIESQNVKAEFEFIEPDVLKVEIRSKGEIQVVQQITCDSKRAFFYFTGAIGIPFFWTKKKEYFTGMQLTGIPAGMLTVREVKKDSFRGSDCDVVNLSLQVENSFDDIVLWVDENGQVLKGISSQQNILIENI
jgi:hypothetical protein